MPGETPVDWITLLQIALALGILSLCCWLIGVTAAARARSNRRDDDLTRAAERLNCEAYQSPADRPAMRCRNRSY